MMNDEYMYDAKDISIIKRYNSLFELLSSISSRRNASIMGNNVTAIKYFIEGFIYRCQGDEYTKELKCWRKFSDYVCLELDYRNPIAGYVAAIQSFTGDEEKQMEIFWKYLEQFIQDQF